MNINQLLDTLRQSIECTNGKYIPWWDFDPEDNMYYFSTYNKEDIQEIHEFISSCDKDELLKPVSCMGLSIFHLLVWNNFYDDVKFLIENGADVNNKAELGQGRLKDVCVGITPIMIACYRGNLAMVKLLVEAGADTSIADEKGRNVYHYLGGYIDGITNSNINNSIQQRKEIVDLLADGINNKDVAGKTPFDYLLENNNSNISSVLAKAYIEKGANVDNVSEEGDSLLITAIKNNHNTAAVELAGNKELINKQNNEGETPLHYAVDGTNLGLCMALLDKGADKNIKNNAGVSPVDMAADCYDDEVQKYLKTGRIQLNDLSRLTSNTFARTSEDNRDNMSVAIYYTNKLVNMIDTDDDDEMKKLSSILNNALIMDEDCQVLDIFNNAGIDFIQPIYGSGSVTCLRDECLGGNYGVKVIKKFIDLGVDMDTAVIKGRTPVNIIASLEERNMYNKKKDDYFEKSVVYFSTESMEELDNEGISAVHYAAKQNHVEMIKVMIDKGVDINITEDEQVSVSSVAACAGNTPLHVACDKGNKEIVEVLINAGADDTLLNVKGMTPAHLVVSLRKFGKELEEEDRISILELLKNVDVPSNEGKTPLMVAQSLDYNASLSVTQTLIDKGVDVNHVDNDGNTALILNTKECCNKDVVKELVKAGADVNALDKHGNSALYYALTSGNQEAARFMIKKGADYNHANNNGVTPMQVAVEKGYDNVLEIMI